MSNVSDFYRIDCDKIDANCVNAYHEFTYDKDNAPTTLCDKTSWGGGCLDLTDLVKAAESCTTMYLSPDTNPNCLVYEPEDKCGDNICIHGDDLSRIISLQKLKDVSQATPPLDGDVYMFNSTTNLFEPYDLKTTIGNLNTATQNINAAITNLQNRVAAIEAKLVPPNGAPNDARVAFTNINLYSDYNATVDGSGTATSLDKAHGIYGHDLNTDTAYDELFG